MQGFIEALYIGSIVCHAAALIIGFVTLAKHGACFRDSCPRQVIHNTMEQKYWTIAFSTICNCIIITTLTPYLYADIGFLPVQRELAFSVYHALAGGIMVLWHTITLIELNAAQHGGVANV